MIDAVAPVGARQLQDAAPPQGVADVARAVHAPPYLRSMDPRLAIVGTASRGGARDASAPS